MKNERQKPLFVPGLILAESFFHEEVEPILKSHYPRLQYYAALIGGGSEVLEFDTVSDVLKNWFITPFL